MKSSRKAIESSAGIRRAENEGPALNTQNQQLDNRYVSWKSNSAKQLSTASRCRKGLAYLEET